MRSSTALAAACLALVAGCKGPDAPREAAPPVTATAPPTTTAAATATSATPPLVASSAPPSAPKLPPVTATYAWKPTATDRLDARFPAPEGFRRVDAPEKSFGAFLRTLPLTPAGTRVLTYKGEPRYPAGEHPAIAAVVDIDVGDKDLQQCADAILRMHAEWRYGLGQRDIAYRALSGLDLPYAKWLEGRRVVAEGNTLSWAPASRATKDEHAVFRSYLDTVFTWANTTSIERDARKVAFADLTPGDFFLMTGNPFGHGVLILDAAKDEKGRVALLLGQSFMPAQSFHVLRPSASTAWFLLDGSSKEIDTPFWKPFPIENLRRL